MIVPTHTQVALRKGSTAQVSWIPSKFAQEGRALKLDNEAGVREGGWVVETVYGTIPSATVAERERDYKRHMEADGRIRKAQ